MLSYVPSGFEAVLGYRRRSKNSNFESMISLGCDLHFLSVSVGHLVKGLGIREAAAVYLPLEITSIESNLLAAVVFNVLMPILLFSTV